MNKKWIASIVCWLFYGFTSFAQEKMPYWDEVQSFKTQDSIQFPAPGKILFIGSSSFTNWKDVQDYFPAFPILNRAFGGSQLIDLISYRYDVIFPYQPKQIIMYCGENDFAVSDTVTVETVVQRFKTLFTLIRAKYPTIPFAYVSMKPSPSRVHLMEKFNYANKQIKSYLFKKNKTKFIDVYHSMLKADGTPIEDIFIEDNLHMNAKGYAIWKKLIAPHLLK